jgi:protein O-GlcNAc transferase
MSKNPSIDTIKANSESKKLKKALKLFDDKNFLEAKKILTSLKLQKNNSFDIYYILGVIEGIQGNSILACDLFKNAIRLKPEHADTYYNLGLTYLKLEDYANAQLNIQTAVNLMPEKINFKITLCSVLYERNLFKQSINHLDEIIKKDSNYIEAFFLKGCCLIRLRQFEEAISILNLTINKDENHFKAYNYLGTALYESGDFLKASISYGLSISKNINYAEAFYNSALTFLELKQPETATFSLLRALELDPNLPYLLGSCLHNKLNISDWDFFDEGLEHCKQEILSGKKSTRPFEALCLYDDEEIHFKTAKIYADKTFPKIEISYNFNKKNSKKIIIGYYSSDFYNHATSHLIAHLFELHDKSNFDIYLFYIGKNALDAMSHRLASSSCQFIDLSKKTDAEVVEISRKLNIDIAIDLKGYTKNERTMIFNSRCAPIQVSYLGYPGTMGADFIDYIIADKTVIPITSQRFYSEKIIYLPDSYQVNDSLRSISNYSFTKQELGLPENKFIFCSFNNNYKLTKDTFNSWIKILKSVDNSVLWILESNKISSNNLISYAHDNGIEKDRVILAKTMRPEMHLARLKLGDLFLDTTPINAHTTASDALWAGLPVLTLLGNSFAGRVAASLLKAFNLPDLITNNRDEYEAKAIEIANDPILVKNLKERVQINKLIAPLFNTELFAKRIEAAYFKIHQLHLNNLDPQNIYIDK